MSAADVIAKAMHDAYQYDANGADAKDILDALAAAGYAVVELPKPVVGNDWDWCAVLSPEAIDDLITESGLLTPEEARTKAAALLAAADAAEAS